MSNLRKFFRRLRTLLWTTLTLLTVMAAVIVGVGKLLMPYSTHYQPELEAWLSKAFNQPVRVESFSGEWKAFGPRISLQGVTLMPEGVQSEIAINEAALDVKPLNALIPGRPLYSFRIIGADLALERTSEGRFILSGLGVNSARPGAERSGLSDVALNGEVRLQDVSLSFDDPEREIHLFLGNINGRLKMDGRDLAAEIQARVTNRDRNRVVGDLDAVVKVRLDAEQHLRRANWHVKTGELMLAELVRQLPHHPLLPVSGRLNAELWGQWERGSPQQMQGVLDLREAQLSSKSGPLLIEHLNSRVKLRFNHRRNWRMDLADLDVTYAGSSWQSQRMTVARNKPRNLGIWISADYLDLDMPLQLTQRIMATYDTRWPAGIPERGQGVVKNFDLVLDAGWQLSMAAGELHDGHLWDWEKGPSITGLDARFELEAGAGNVSIEGEAVTLDWPRVFRRPIAFALEKCNVEALWQLKASWQLDVNRCRVQNDDLSVIARVRLASNEGKPEVDINAAMQRGEVARFGDYWPENIMKPRTLHWLRTSLMNGKVSGGRYSMVGDMDDFPFKNHSGSLLADVKVSDAHLKYAEGWPHARQVTATAHFEGPGMHVEGTVGNTVGTAVDYVSARIDDFKAPVLDLDYRTATGLPELVEFLKFTPLLNNLDLDLEKYVLEGPAEISGHLRTGLGQTVEPLQVHGALMLMGDRFTELTSGVVIDDMEGVLDYHQEGLEAMDLTGSYKGFPVSLEVVSDWDAKEVFRASLHGMIPVDRVIPADLLESEPLFSHASGDSLWDIGVSVTSEDDSEERETWLDIYSGLQGVTIDLPEPLGKPADLEWPVLVHYPIRAEEQVLTAVMPGQLQLKMELSRTDGHPTRAVVQFGGKVKDLPDTGQFVIDGSAEVFDFDSWTDLTVDRFTETSDVGGLTLSSAHVDAGQILIFNRLFEDVGLSMTYGNGVINGKFDGEDINGTVRFYKNDSGSHSMSGEFERLIMPDPVAGGMSMETDPSELPEIHFFSKEFSYLGLELGETRIEGYPIEDGFHLEFIEASSPQLKFNARGDWLNTSQGVRSDFDIRMTSESLGTVLDAMDISSAIQGGQTVVHFNAWWNGPPAAFALANLNGEMDISVIQGNILTADPGAGRMLGLLSLTELPRRLAMDFRDVFDEGFAFDEAKGTMHLENGTSYTEDLTLSSTAAEIAITGSTDLAGQTFDYEVAVRPGVSKTLPVIGAIAGGPAGAAAGIALQTLLRDALGEAAEARYTIQGPWADPQVELVTPPPRTPQPGNIPEQTPEPDQDALN
ncbi:MAG: YhdP family protein [Xanthomonadales bacterium]|nr:YhdP family protein [Xanthomonadales bacterium]